MTKDEALKLALDALERCVATCFDPYAHEQVMSRREHFVNQTIFAIQEALEESENDELIIRYHEMTIKRLEKRIEELTAQPEQEAAAFIAAEDKKVASRYGYVPKLHPSEWQDDFCLRCGKRTADLTTIHTCTPPQENT